MSQAPRRTPHYRKVELFKTEKLGDGAFGTVCKAKCDEFLCAAKSLHNILLSADGTGNVMERFERECNFMRDITHPNIVQYLGTYQDPESGLPVLLMELLDESLTKFLERSQVSLPYHVQVNLCHDVAMALAYLHSKGIMHRDLSSNNVLIAGNRAKVADFGMSKLGARMTRMTKCPGTPVYMPPEALNDPREGYTYKLDSFSFGVLAIQIMTRQFPDPGPQLKTVPNNQSPVGEVKVPVLETERRRSHIKLIDPSHPLLATAKECLEYYEDKRPSARELCQQLEALKKAHLYNESVQRVAEEQRRHTQQAQEMLNLQHQLQVRGQELETVSKELQRKDKLLATLQQQIRQLEKELKQKSGNITAKEGASNELSWCKCPHAPAVMHFGSAAVDGAIAYFRPGLMRRVYSYDSDIEKWSTLPMCPKAHSSLAIVDGLLTTVGGEHEGEPTDLLFSLVTRTEDPANREWEERFPPMPTKRTFSVVQSSEEALIVAGGKAGIYAPIPTVEVMHTKTWQWSALENLPIPLHLASAALCDDRLYLAGGVDEAEKGTNLVFTCSLTALLQPRQRSASLGEWLKTTLSLSGSESKWHRVAALPAYWSTCVAFNGRLVAVGGRGVGNKYSASVYVYNPAADEWDVLTSMPTARSECLAAALPHNRLMVVGGFNDKGESSIVEIAKFL